MSEVNAYYKELLAIVGEEKEEACDLVLNINGYSIETMNDILYALTGYHDIPQYKGE